jgi:cathepsin C
MRMMEARLKLIYNHHVNLSVQHALDCSFYNQGCDGGYPILVMKFANEFELIPETCKPYTVIYYILKII